MDRIDEIEEKRREEKGLYLGGIFSDDLDQEGEGKVHQLVSPSVFKGNIGSNNIVASIQCSSEAFFESFLNKELEETFGNILFLRIGSGMDGILV